MFRALHGFSYVLQVAFQNVPECNLRFSHLVFYVKIFENIILFIRIIHSQKHILLFIHCVKYSQSDPVTLLQICGT